MSRELVNRLRFDRTLNTPELDFYVRAALVGSRFYFCSDWLAYRVHSESATSSGLTIDRLFFKMAQVKARSADARRTRFRQLATLAPTAVLQAVSAEDGKVIRIAKKTGALWGSWRGSPPPPRTLAPRRNRSCTSLPLQPPPRAATPASSSETRPGQQGPWGRKPRVRRQWSAADATYVLKQVDAGLVKSPCLELGVGYGGATLRRQLESRGMKYDGTDIVPGQDVDFPR